MPYSAAVVVADADDFIYSDGMLCYTQNNDTLRLLHLHGSADSEIVIDIHPLLLSIPGLAIEAMPETTTVCSVHLRTAREKGIPSPNDSLLAELKKTLNPKGHDITTPIKGFMDDRSMVYAVGPRSSQKLARWPINASADPDEYTGEQCDKHLSLSHTAVAAGLGACLGKDLFQ
ncbi:hypothetical protein CSHISOI_01882 [Colletotrichum shisoi]|uniref:Uncharacterized protein n=1 Tax=Colletotrichum shisoi TaxID=2078593 RepID=A0A5Q4C4I0_9PEZI|nr:hypothetical protein CSHISOI_01882 [Colletotrichum shisoi]